MGTSRAGTMGQVQRVTRPESPGCLAMDKTTSPCLTTPLSTNPRRWHLSLSCASTPGPEQQQKLVQGRHGSHQDQRCGLMTPALTNQWEPWPWGATSGKFYGDPPWRLPDRSSQDRGPCTALSMGQPSFPTFFFPQGIPLLQSTPVPLLPLCPSRQVSLFPSFS